MIDIITPKVLEGTVANRDYLEIVRKLLAKAEADGTTPEEAEALTAKAAELMAQHRIDQAMIGSLHKDNKPIGRKITCQEPYATAKRSFLGWLAVAMGCDAVLMASDTATIHLFGYEADLDLCEILFNSLLVQQARDMFRAERELSSYERKHIRAWRRSFMLGFASAASTRVKEANKKTEDAAKANTPGTALVLADRSLAVSAAKKQEYPRLRATKVTYTGSGYTKGHAAGSRADIGGARVGQRSRAALR
jgi:hypothetical protein